MLNKGWTSLRNEPLHAESFDMLDKVRSNSEDLGV